MVRDRHRKRTEYEIWLAIGQPAVFRFDLPDAGVASGKGIVDLENAALMDVGEKKRLETQKQREEIFRSFLA